MKIVKLDGRYRGYPEYKYRVVFDNPKGVILKDSQRINQLLEVRNWFHDTFGPSCEYEYIHHLRRATDKFNEKWCWDNRALDLKIFIADDATLNWFSLRWMQ